MNTPKIKTTVYSHKVIDVVKFDLYDSYTDAVLDTAELMAIDKNHIDITVAMIEPYQTVKTLISKGKERYGKP